MLDGPSDYLPFYDILESICKLFGRCAAHSWSASVSPRQGTFVILVIVLFAIVKSAKMVKIQEKHSNLKHLVCLLIILLWLEQRSVIFHSQVSEVINGLFRFYSGDDSKSIR